MFLTVLSGAEETFLYFRIYDFGLNDFSHARRLLNPLLETLDFSCFFSLIKSLFL